MAITAHRQWAGLDFPLLGQELSAALATPPLDLLHAWGNIIYADDTYAYKLTAPEGRDRCDRSLRVLAALLADDPAFPTVSPAVPHARHVDLGPAGPWVLTVWPRLRLTPVIPSADESNPYRELGRIVRRLHSAQIPAYPRHDASAQECADTGDVESAQKPGSDLAGLSLRTEFLRTWPSLTDDRAEDPQPGVVNNFATRLPEARPLWIVQHYTYDNYDVSLDIFLSENGPSSHYLLPRDAEFVQQLVAPEYRAYHAGPGALLPNSALNPFVGQEGLKSVMNSWSYGFENENNASEPFPEGQIIRNIQVMDFLVSHTDGLDPRFVIGHSDWAFGRKIDPGPYFPWSLLSRARVAYPDITRYNFGVYSHISRSPVPQVLVSKLKSNSNADITRIQHGLRDLGYPVSATGELDEATLTGMFTFKIHYQNEVVLHEYESNWAAIVAEVDVAENRDVIAQWTVDDGHVLDDVLRQYRETRNRH